jgi:protein phosphatase
MIQVQKLNLDKSKRMIITSDIHGNLNLFKRLLDKVNYSSDDYLFINGDLCEKGPNSLEVVNYVRKLINENVFVTKGNCDVVHRYVFNGNEGIIPYIQNRTESILNEMMAKYDKSLDDFLNLQELTVFYKENFSEMINWLESLPIAYETDDYIMVHAGIDNLQDWYETEEATALYAKSFHESDHQSEKTVIVGHWPVINYRSNQICSHNPLLDLEKRIISIDGGNCIKKDGQLNALIIEEGHISFEFVDDLEREVIVTRDHIDTTNRVGAITYPNYEMNVLERETYFTKCENINLKMIQWLKNEYLIEENGKFYSKDDVSMTFLTVKLGECFKIVDDECDGYVLVKKDNGEIGWIPQNCILK